MRTQDDLGVLWRLKDGYVEAPGISFYGYWGMAEIPRDLEPLHNPWSQTDTEIAIERIELPEGNHLAITVLIRTFPKDFEWIMIISQILVCLAELGAKVSWCGGLLCSWTLAELDPETSSGLLYAAFSNATGLIIHAGLYDEIEYLSDDELRKLAGIITEANLPS